MQENSNDIISTYLKTNKNTILSSFFLLCLVYFSIVIFNNKFYLLVIPSLLLACMYFIIFPQYLFALLLFVLPFTIEYDYQKSIIDIPSEPIMFLLAIYVFLYCIIHYQKVRKHLTNNYIFLFIFLHLSITYFTTIFSTNILVSIKTCIVKTVYIFAYYIATLIFIEHKKKWIQYFWIIWIPTFCSILLILFLHAKQGFMFDSINLAVIPIYRNHVNYGVFITMLFPFLFYIRTQYQKGSINRLFFNVSILVTLVAIYFTYTRGAWLALLAMPIYFLIIQYKWSKKILWIAIFSIFTFLAYLISNYNYLKYAPNYDTTIYHDDLNAHLSSTFEMEDMSTVERFYRWLAAIRMSKHKILYGVGAGNFTANYKPYTVAAYQTYISDNEEKSTVHNYFLLLLTEQGIFSLIVFVCFIFYIILYIEKSYHKTTNKENKILIIAIAMSILTFLLNNTLSDLVEANKVGSLFWINLALLYHFSSNKNQEYLNTKS
jgi:O-antigen ligase